MKTMRFSVYRESTPLLVFEDWMETPSPNTSFFQIENAEGEIKEMGGEKVIFFKKGNKKITFIRGEYHRRGKWAPDTIGYPTSLIVEKQLAIHQAMNLPITLLDHTESWSNGGGFFEEYFIFETPMEGEFPLLVFIKKVSEKRVRNFVLFSNGKVEDYEVTLIQGKILDIDKLK